jgi:NAD(P)-dependent dehydrogenase (short-subunit alcohol dehydrogenase family)
VSRVALITGGTDGIGKATAKHLVAAGWEVVITARNATRAEEAARAISGGSGPGRVSVIEADLADMTAVREAAATFRGRHARLDVLLLNANAITQRRVLTRDGFEANLAVGYLGRVLLLRELEDVLAATPQAQVLTVVGLDHERLDLDDPQLELRFTARSALMRWQWAMQLYVREHTRRGGVPMNVYMPGLVRTKILANEPQPMRLAVQIMNFVIGIPVEQAAAELAGAIEDARGHGRRDTYYWRTKPKPPRALGERPDDAAQLWALTDRLLAPHTSTRG